MEAKSVVQSGWVRRALSAVADLLDRLVADRPQRHRIPLANYIPNSDGSRGRVISSGHPGGGGS